MNAEEVLRKICEGPAGVSLQTVLVDGWHPEDEPVLVCSYECLAKVEICPELTVMKVLLRLETEDQYTDLCEAIETMECIRPQDTRAIAHIATFIPAQQEGDEIVYASGYIGAATSDAGNLAVTLLIHPDDFNVFALDAEKLPEDAEDGEGDSGEETAPQPGPDPQDAGAPQSRPQETESPLRSS